jgi:histidinol-phosphatase
LFGTLIGYVENDEPVVGVAHFPALGETIFAAKGLGCWYKLRGETPQQVTVASPLPLNQAFVSACGVTPSDIDPRSTEQVYRISALIPQARKFRFITDCLQHTLVAHGRIDAAIDLILHPWDIAALVPCVEEAGGVVSDLDGNRQGILWKPTLLSCSNPVLQSQIIMAVADDPLRRQLT